MTKIKISKLDYNLLAHDYMRDKAIEKGFVFTMVDRSGREWFLSAKELYECSDVSFKDATTESLKKWREFQETFRSEVEKILNEKYEITMFTGYGMPIN